VTTKQEKVRDLMDAEILAMWPGLPLVHRFLLATGQPLEDVIRMDWSDIDKETRIWYRSKASAHDSWDLMIPQWVITWLPKSTGHTGVFLNGTGEPLTSDAVTDQLSKHVSSICMESVTPEDIRDYVRNQMTELGNAELAAQVVDQASAIPAARVPLEHQVAAQTVLLEQWSYRLQEIVLEGGATLGDTPLSNSH
jgi:integrase